MLLSTLLISRPARSLRVLNVLQARLRNPNFRFQLIIELRQDDDDCPFPGHCPRVQGVAGRGQQARGGGLAAEDEMQRSVQNNQRSCLVPVDVQTSGSSRNSSRSLRRSSTTPVAVSAAP